MGRPAAQPCLYGIKADYRDYYTCVRRAGSERVTGGYTADVRVDTADRTAVLPAERNGKSRAVQTSDVFAEAGELAISSPD